MCSAFNDLIRKAKWEDSFRLETGTVLTPDQKLTVFVPLNDALHKVMRVDRTEQLKDNVTYIREVTTH